MSLKQLRKDRGLTQKDLADFLKCTQVTYQRYESGERDPGVDNLKKLSRFFETSIDQILDNGDYLINPASPEYETELILASRNADERAKQDALQLLLRHKAH